VLSRVRDKNTREKGGSKARLQPYWPTESQDWDVKGLEGDSGDTIKDALVDLLDLTMIILELNDPPPLKDRREWSVAVSGDSDDSESERERKAKLQKEKKENKMAKEAKEKGLDVGV
jgi:hypothetical protein